MGESVPFLINLSGSPSIAFPLFLPLPLWFLPKSFSFLFPLISVGKNKTMERIFSISLFNFLLLIALIFNLKIPNLVLFLCGQNSQGLSKAVRETSDPPWPKAPSSWNTLSVPPLSLSLSTHTIDMHIDVIVLDLEWLWILSYMVFVDWRWVSCKFPSICAHNENSFFYWIKVSTFCSLNFIVLGFMWSLFFFPNSLPFVDIIELYDLVWFIF